MHTKRNWEQLFAEAEEQIRQWRKEHKRATLTQIEQAVDGQMARVRARIVEEMVQDNELANLQQVKESERPVCPVCGRKVGSSGIHVVDKVNGRLGAKNRCFSKSSHSLWNRVVVLRMP